MSLRRRKSYIWYWGFDVLAFWPNQQMHQQQAHAARTLFNVYSSLRGHFGYADPWWPGSAWEVTVSAVLVQRCDWSFAWKGICELRERDMLAVPHLAAANADAMMACLVDAKVAFASQKSVRLIRLAQSLLERGFADLNEYLAASRETDMLRQELLSFNGIGPETADCILLFAGEHRTFVIDEYTRRAFERLQPFAGLDDGFWRRPYQQLREFLLSNTLVGLPLYDCFNFASHIPREIALLRDFHAQLVELGRHHCLRRKPRCHRQGKRGWKDFSFCDSHCTSCGSCPLAAVCCFA